MFITFSRHLTFLHSSLNRDLNDFFSSHPRTWSVDGLSVHSVLAHGIINVLDQPVVDLNELAADGGDGLWVPVRFLVWLVIINIYNDYGTTAGKNP